MAINKHLQIFRNTNFTAVTTYNDAVAAMKAQAANLDDGTPIVYRYGTDKVILGVARTSGETKTVDIVADETQLKNELHDLFNVTVDSTTEGLDAGVLKRYTIKQGGTAVTGGTIDLPKDYFVTSGSLVDVDGKKNIKLVLNTPEQTVDSSVLIPVNDLVDVYTGSTGDVTVAVSDSNEISATIKDGGVHQANLDAALQALITDMQAIEDAPAEGNAAVIAAKIETTTKVKDAVVNNYKAVKAIDASVMDIDGRVKSLEAVEISKADDSIEVTKDASGYKIAVDTIDCGTY